MSIYKSIVICIIGENNPIVSKEKVMVRYQFTPTLMLESEMTSFCE